MLYSPGQSKFHWRRQSQEGRISTVEAAALVLEELGRGDAGDALRKALAILMDALGRQCHHESWPFQGMKKMKKLKQGALGLIVWRGYAEVVRLCIAALGQRPATGSVVHSTRVFLVVKFKVSSPSIQLHCVSFSEV